MIICNPFLYAMKMLPNHSRAVMMVEEDVLALQSNWMSGAPSTMMQRLNVSPGSICTNPATAELPGPKNTPFGGSHDKDSVITINHMDADWARVQPLTIINITC